jgi:hypothetical protein
MTAASYDWPKTSGTPIYDYELRLPAGVALSKANLLDMTLWDDTAGTGCSVTELRHLDGRAQVSGKFVFGGDNLAPTMSMRLRDGTVHPHPEGYWRMSVVPATKPGAEFSLWQKIEFIAPPRAVPSVPPGDYEIRYRLRRFI